MRMDLALGLLLAAVVANGLLVGASLDQSIKQLPARRRIGVLAFCAYLQAADLANGRVWYPVIGVGAALLTLAAAIVGLASATHRHGQQLVALAAAAVLTLAHSLVTARAAPTNFSQRHAGTDERALTQILDRFEQLQTLRACLQVATLAACVWALVAMITTH